MHLGEKIGPKREGIVKLFCTADVNDWVETELLSVKVTAEYLKVKNWLFCATVSKNCTTVKHT
jgi:hypothetical protein